MWQLFSASVSKTSDCEQHFPFAAFGSATFPHTWEQLLTNVQADPYWTQSSLWIQLHTTASSVLNDRLLSHKRFRDLIGATSLQVTEIDALSPHIPPTDKWQSEQRNGTEYKARDPLGCPTGFSWRRIEKKHSQVECFNRKGLAVALWLFSPVGPVQHGDHTNNSDI